MYSVITSIQALCSFETSWVVEFTLRVDRKNVPKDVKELKEALGGRKVLCGTGYYLRSGDLVYVCWRESQPVLAISASYPGHQSDTKVTRKVGSSASIAAQQ